MNKCWKAFLKIINKSYSERLKEDRKLTDKMLKDDCYEQQKGAFER